MRRFLKRGKLWGDIVVGGLAILSLPYAGPAAITDDMQATPVNYAGLVIDVLLVSAIAGFSTYLVLLSFLDLRKPEYIRGPGHLRFPRRLRNDFLKASRSYHPKWNPVREEYNQTLRQALLDLWEKDPELFRVLGRVLYQYEDDLPYINSHYGDIYDEFVVPRKSEPDTIPDVPRARLLIVEGSPDDVKEPVPWYDRIMRDE